ncbi:hypothetical protein ABPG72_015695 [Tetrahymena utriculariae]
MELQASDNQPLVTQQKEKKKKKPVETAQLKSYESYFSPKYFTEVFIEVTYKSIPRLLNYEFNLLTMSLINIYLLGQKGNLQDIKIFGLGDIWARIFAYSLIKYKNMTLQQECTIALSAKNYFFVGISYQRSLFIVGLICIFSAPFLCFWWKALILFGIEKAVATKAGDYMWVCLPSVFCYGYYDTTNNYLQSQNILWPQFGIQFIQAIIHYFIAHTMIINQNMGVLGAAWAKNFSDALSAGLIYAFITLKNPTRKTWIEWNSRAFDGIQDYLKQSLRNGIGQYVEEVAFLFLTMMSMYLSDPANTATHIALQNSGLLHFSFYLGFHFVVNNYINSSLSRGFVDRAKRKAFMCVITLFFWIGIVMFILLNNKTQWSEWFSSNSVVQQNLQNSIKIYAKIVVLDGIQLTFCAIVKALDHFNHITIIYSVSYYLIGISTSLYQGFYLGKGEYGIWTGWLTSASVSSVVFFFVFVLTNWQNQSVSIKANYNKVIIKDIISYQKNN